MYTPPDGKDSSGAGRGIGNGFGITAIVVALFGLIFAGMFAGLLAIVIAIVGVRKDSVPRPGIAGILLGLLAFLSGLVAFLFFFPGYPWPGLAMLVTHLLQG